MRSQKSKNTQKMYKLLDEFISYMYDKRTGSDMTADSYYRDIDRFITYRTDHDITGFNGLYNTVVIIFRCSADHIEQLRIMIVQMISDNLMSATSPLPWP